MSPSVTLETPIIENKTFLLRDPMMIDDANFLKQQDDDDFSTDSWERVSNEELDDIVQITNNIMSPPSSPSTSLDSPTTFVKNEPVDCLRNFAESLDSLESPPILIKMEAPSPPTLINIDNLTTSLDDQSMLQLKDTDLLNETHETRTMKRERNRLAARRCRQKQKDRIDYLERDVKQIETENFKVENEIKMLRQQLKDLQNALFNHNCLAKQGVSPRQQYYSVKF